MDYKWVTCFECSNLHTICNFDNLAHDEKWMEKVQIALYMQGYSKEPPVIDFSPE